MKKIVKPSYDNGKNKPVRTTPSGITRRRPRSIRKGEPSWKIHYDTEEEYQNAMKAKEQLRQKQTQQYLQKKDREAAEADKLFGSLRSANNASAEQINKPVISKKQIKQAQKEQEEKNINTWKPALNTVDLGVNLVSLLRPNPYMYAGSMLWDAFQMGDDIATGDAPINSAASLLFDGIGYAGATNRLKPVTIRIPRSRSTSGLPRSHQMTINTDKVADVTGTGFNVLDSSSDVYGIGKFGLNYANTQNPNLMFKPFSYDDGKDKNKSLVYYDSSTGEYSSDLSPKLTVLNRIGDDPTQWTYTDDKGRLYTPTQTQVNSGEITQGKDPSAMDRFLSWSNRHYNDPILGAAARYANTVKNNQDPITGVASFMPGVGEAVDVLSAASDFLSGNYKQAAIGGALSLLPFVPYSKVRNIVNSFGSNVIVPAMMRFSGNNQSRIQDTAQMFANDRFRNDILNLSGDNYYRSHNGAFRNNGTSKRFISYGGVYPGFEGYRDWHLSGRIKTPGKHVYEIPKDAIGDLPAVNDSGQRASGMIGDYNNPFGNQATIHDIKLSEAIKNSPHIEYVQTPAGTQRILHLGKLRRNRNNIDNTSTIRYEDAVSQRMNDELYQSYLNDPETIRDMQTRMELENFGFFGPDYYGYINDYNGIYDENKQIHNAIQSAMNNPNITEDQVIDLIGQRGTASYPFYPPYPFSASSEILNSYERAQNAKRDLNNNYPIENLFQFRDNVHDNNIIQQMRDLVQHYRNAEQSGEPLQQMLMPSLFVRDTNNPEFISLRDELYRYQDLARRQEHERLRQQFEQIPKPTNSTQIEENSLTDKQIANSLMRNEPYDPNNLPEEFIDATSDVSDRTSAAYFYDDPKRALQEARSDFELLQHGQAWNLNHHGAVSTDSYPLMLSMFRRRQKDGLIKPIKDKDGNIKFMRLNSFGKHKGEAAVERINKIINNLSETIGEQLPEAQVDNGNIYVPQVLFRKYGGGKDSAGNWVNAIYSNNPKEHFLGKPSHNYDVTIPEEEANRLGYYPDARGHRDDRVKKLAHPTHPKRGNWNGDEFALTDFGMQNPNYTMFGVVDGNQDPQAILTYKDGIVLPEFTVTPDGNYIMNDYDNIRLNFNKGKDSGIHIKKANRGKFTAAAKRAGMGVQAYARKILSAPKGKYSPTLRRRAAFARAASKFKH